MVIYIHIYEIFQRFNIFNPNVPITFSMYKRAAGGTAECYSGDFQILRVGGVVLEYITGPLQLFYPCTLGWWGCFQRLLFYLWRRTPIICWDFTVYSLKTQSKQICMNECLKQKRTTRQFVYGH